ncbi:U-box domain-containing protein 15-like [Vitis riparia]|uniref:U-box domain-containing protein 15-like n=1 Tax=Vitis riparia TaxID=96939 RepID=UPI00155A06F7|nr:U-box domain-containing protein 15-like [Vitis riparia]
MVMDGEVEEGGGGQVVETGEEETAPNASNTQGCTCEVQELMVVIGSIVAIGDYRRTQKKECQNLVRRLKLLLPLLEDVKDHHGQVSEKSLNPFWNLKKALLRVKKLLITCSEGSKIYLALENEAVMARFHRANDKLSQALEDLPYEELGVSEEVKEELDLVRMHLKRSKRRTDTQDIELAMDMMVVFSKDDERNADSAIIVRLAKKLELHTVEDLNAETIAVRKFVKERGGQNAESTQHVIELLNKFRQSEGLEEINVLDDPIVPKTLEKSPSLAIPHEFLCPITLEIMTDPVFVATGQTYERESIQKWLDSNHKTCPKTMQPLVHSSLVPNYALRNLILQWCENNNFQIPKKDASSSTEGSSEQKESVLSVVQNLSSNQLEVQRKAVKKIRMLSKENPVNRVLIAQSGGIPPLVQLLSYPDSKIQEHTVTALLNLSIDEANKKLIAIEGAIPAIIDVLRKGSVEAKGNSAAALFSLSIDDDIKATIGLSNGIPPLVDLLQHGTIRGKRDAATALFNLSLNKANKTRAIEAGVIPPLLQLIKSPNSGMIDEALSILFLLASHPDGRQEIGQLSVIETLVEFIRDGTTKNKECATSVLLELGSSNSSFILAALQYGVLEHLIEITKSGNSRAQRKANSLLQLMSRCEQIP